MSARDYEAIRSQIRALVEDVVRPNAARIDLESVFPRDNLAALAREHRLQVDARRVRTDDVLDQGPDLTSYRLVVSCRHALSPLDAVGAPHLLTYAWPVPEPDTAERR